MAADSFDLREWVERVKDRVEIESVIARKVQLQRRGSRLLGLCPFHPEKTPSFSVSPDQGFFKCFGCGKGGDVLTFVQEVEGLDFWEALRRLAEEAGVQLPDRMASSQSSLSPLRDQARKALRLARKFYEQALADQAQAQAYLQSRSLTAESIRSFGVGWAPASPGWLLQKLAAEGLRAEALVEAGLAYQAEGDSRFRDRFWDRVVFPVADSAGRTVGFGGRYLPGSKGEARGMGKYVNSPESSFFPKRRLLYGLDRLAAGLRDLPDQPILVCEGYLDVVLLHQAGFRTSVAALGTALTEDHARRLSRFQRQVALLLDPDPAGRRAAARAARVLVQEGVDVRMVELPDGQDPADMVASDRGAELSQRIADARDILEWRLATWTEKADFQVPGVKAKAAQEMSDWIAATPDPALAEVWTRLAGDRLGLSEASLRRSGGHGGASFGKRMAADAGASPPKFSARDVLERNEREIIAALLHDPSLYSRHRRELEALELQDSWALRVLKWCRTQRQQGSGFDLLQALEAFSGDPLLVWLDSLRHLNLAKPKEVLERALRMLPSNREGLRREQRLQGREPADEDLARWFSTRPLSPKFDGA
ncbi:MAG: DNA primase [Planctomycetota bacterium]|nr:MAG: DNA primase [Planctomycetota bacterium]